MLSHGCPLRSAVKLCSKYSYRLHGCIITLYPGANYLQSSLPELLFSSNTNRSDFRFSMIGNSKSYASCVSSQCHLFLSVMSSNASLSVNMKNFDIMYFGYHDSTLSGALLISNTNNLTITNVKFTGNYGLNGGALLISDTSYVHISECTFENNIAQSNGGGISFSHVANVNLTSSVFTNNTAGSMGGALSVENYSSTILLDKVHILMNSAHDSGGGVYVSENVENIETRDCRISNNRAGVNGGAIAIDANTDNSMIASTIIEGNTAASGGGIYLGASNRNVYIVDCSVHLNTAQDRGGGLMLDTFNTEVFIINTSISNNVVSRPQGSGGGLYVYRNNSYVNILDGSYINLNCASVGGGLAIISYNHNVRISGVTISENVASVYGGGVYIGSYNAEIDVAGNTVISYNTATSMGGGVSIDRDSSPVHFSDSTITDNKASVGGGVALSSYVSNIYFDNMIVRYNQASDGGGIAINSYAFNINITSSIIYDNVAGRFGGGIMIDSYTNNVYVVLSYITDNTGVVGGGGVYVGLYNSNVYFSGCKIIGNDGGMGGGFYFQTRNTMYVGYSTIAGNYASAAVESGEIGGGAMMHDANAFIMTHVIFSNNIAYTGAGLAMNVGHNQSSISYCVFHGNFALEAGGGIHASLSNLNIKITNTVFINNTATLSGGAISFGIGNILDLSDSKFIRNIAIKGAGGALYLGIYSAYCSIERTVFYNNLALEGGAISVAQFFGYSHFYDLIFQANLAYSLWGAIILNSEIYSIEFDNVTFSENIALEYGGAIYIGLNANQIQLKNLSFIYNGALQQGGAIYVSDIGNAIYFINLLFFKNSAVNSYGGSIFIGVANRVFVYDCTFVDGLAVRGGAGIYMDSDNFVTITNCKFINNVLIEITLVGSGGAIYSATHNSLLITGSIFFRNEAQEHGAAIYLSGWHLSTVICSCLFFYNIVLLSDGGAITIDGTSNADVNFANNTFIGNVAGGDGGALVVRNAVSVSFHGNVWLGNQAAGRGGAILAESLAFTNWSYDSFRGNVGQQGGGALFMSQGHSCVIEGTAFVRNTASWSSFGSAVHVSDAKNVSIMGNTFRYHTISGGGTVYWEVVGVEPWGLTTTNHWDNNSAAYGSQWATDLYAIFSIPSMFVPRYQYEGNSPLSSLTITARDFYGSRIPTSRNTKVILAISHDSGCRPFAGTIHGVVQSDEWNDGILAFKDIQIFCKPGGILTLGYSILTLTNFTRLEFESCLKGDPTQTQSCTCPTAAEKCNGSSILVKEGEWLASEESYSIQTCDFESACRGGEGYGDELCSDGYEGPLCGGCRHGYFPTGLEAGQCSYCQSSSVQSYVVVLVPVFVVLLFGAALYAFNRHYIEEIMSVLKKSDFNVVVYLKIIFSTFQVCSIFFYIHYVNYILISFHKA